MTTNKKAAVIITAATYFIDLERSFHFYLKALIFGSWQA